MKDKSDLIEYLSEPIIFDGDYYFLQVSKTRCWYQTIDGKKLEFKDNWGGWTEFVRSGYSLTDALQNMSDYLEHESLKGLWEQEDKYKQIKETK